MTATLWCVLAAVSALAQAAPAEDLPEIWKAALRVRTGPTRGAVVLMRETAGECGATPRHPCFRLPDVTRLTPAVPPQLLQRLRAQLHENPRAVEGLDQVVRPVSRAELEEMLASGGGPEKIWQRFYARYPDTDGFAVVSNPALDDRGDRALLLMNHFYGDLGAKGHLILLERDKAAGGEAAYWRVAQTWTLWIS